MAEAHWRIGTLAHWRTVEKFYIGCLTGLPLGRQKRYKSTSCGIPTTEAHFLRGRSGIRATPKFSASADVGERFLAAGRQTPNRPIRNPTGFDESQNTTLTSAISAGAGVVLSGAGLASGLTVASHYVFFDPTTGHVIGKVTFDSTVLAILTSTGTLAASDYLANTGVTYLNPSARGLEAGDFATITGMNEVSINFTASTPGDYVRVLTAFSPGALPEPASLALVGLALGLGALLRRAR